MSVADSNNPFARRATLASRLEQLVVWLFRLTTYLVILAASVVFLDIILKGAPVVFTSEAPFINMEFLTESPETLHVFEYEGEEYAMGFSKLEVFKRQHEIDYIATETRNYSAGGIFPCIIGTLLLVGGSIVIALLLGVLSAIYLSEYAKEGPRIRAIRLSIINLAGVPSIVFGIFGVGLFVLFLNWGVSLLAGWFTLAFMALPIIITASEESLRAVPRGFREGALALGATQWATVRKNVLPYALPGILTSSVLSITRVAGETAPIMFTAAYAYRDNLPWQGLENWYDFFFQGVMALPYHIYVVSAKIPSDEYTRRMQYGSVFVFMVLVFIIALASIILRARMRKKYQW